MPKNHNIDDNNSPLLVDPAARKVTIPLTQRVFGTVGDHCSEQVTFQIPNIIDGHDMPGCTRKYVSWRNVDGELGHDDLRLKKTKADNSLYAWTIRDALTVAKGIVSFSLHFECIDEDGTLLYRWSTTTCSDGEILDSINAVVGAYKAIYLDGETLVFADYTPVHEETIELRTGILPRDTLEITERGKHDVAAYAYIVNNTLGEEIILTVENGVVKASANGREGEIPLESPTISVDGSGLIKSSANGLAQQAQLKGAMLTNMKAANIKKGIKVLDVVGTYDPIEGTAPTVVIENGVVQATANGQTTQKQLVGADVPGLTPDIIAKGVTVLDVTGTYVSPGPDINVPLNYSLNPVGARGATVKWSYMIGSEARALATPTSNQLDSADVPTTLRRVAKGSIITFCPDAFSSFSGYNAEEQADVELIVHHYNFVAFRITGDSPTIKLHLTVS